MQIFKFINLIRNAEYVIGDSFHMSIFSIIFHKNFLVFNRYKETDNNSRNTRVKNLLEQLKLTDRYLNSVEYNIVKKFNYVIDYEQTDKILSEWKAHSLEYLRNIL